MPQCEVFSDYIVQCTDELQVNALLAPATQYKWVIVDKFDNESSGFSTTDGNGFFVISIIDLPEGLLTKYSGEFTLKVFSATDDCKQVSFKCAKYYDEICLHVRAGNRVKNNLGCSFECTSPDGGNGNSAVFEISNQSTIHINWSSLLNSFYGSAPLIQVYEETTPGVFNLVTVAVTQNRSGYVLDSIDIDFGGSITSGYVLIS